MKRYLKWAYKVPFVQKVLDKLTSSQKQRVDGKEFCLGLPFMDFLYDGPVIFHNVQFEEQGRLDLIAWKYYDNAYLWEIIALYNGIDDPIGEVKTGVTLMIPTGQISQNTNYRAHTYEGVSY